MGPGVLHRFGGGAFEPWPGRDWISVGAADFRQIIRADEINRAPAKVQSAPPRSDAERQVTIGETTF